MTDAIKQLWALIVASGPNAILYAIFFFLVVFFGEHLGWFPNGNARRIALGVLIWFMSGTLPAIIPSTDAAVNLTTNASHLTALFGGLYAALIHELPGIFSSLKTRTGKPSK